MGKVLLVLPDEHVRIELSEFLGREGHQVTFAANADTACRALRSRPYDLIVVAPVLPGQNGLRLIPQLSELAGWAPVLVAGPVSDPLMDRAEGCGAVGVLELPLDPDSAGSIVAGAMDQRSPWDWERRVA